MFCARCGTENPEGAKFCSKCGAKFGTPVAPKPEAESSTGREHMEKTRGFVASLFDLSFKDFVTPRVIAVLYVILLVVAGITAIGLIVTMFMMGPGPGILALLILGPLCFFLSAIGSRVWLELIMVIFGIKDELAAMHDTVRKSE